MRAELQKTIEELKKLDLSSFPYNEILEQIRNAGEIGHLQVTLHQEKSIYRARLNEPDEHFYSRCQLTYKPQQFNKTCQRASTPQMTMFYGSILPEELEEGELDLTRVVPTYEAIPWLRDKTTKGIETITYSRWIVKKDINLLAILQHDEFYDRSSYTRRLMNDYNNFLDQYPDKKEDTIAFTTFIASEFAKEVVNEYDYLISAAFTKSIIDKGFDGILYPSVKLNGAGFNVALTPEAADTKLDLAVVVECSAYKLYEHTVLDNDLDAILYPNQTHFELREIDREGHAGIEICLEKLGINSINDLQ
jgi:hypothetical protein